MDKNSEFDCFLTEVKNLSVPEKYRAQMLNILDKYAGRSIYIRADGRKLKRLHAVSELMKSKTRAESAEAISKRFGVSCSTAYRWMASCYKIEFERRQGCLFND